ncbi:Predicted gene 14326 [Apodemus speciosus]|uniref:Predicted gene 14326 n=1 Tax=Apodemus speciosus TaxID=105296 RepID=A0ABQ0ESE4_APOSI
MIKPVHNQVTSNFIKEHILKSSPMNITNVVKPLP